MARPSFTLAINLALLLAVSAYWVDNTGPESWENFPREDTSEADFSEPELRIQNGLPLQAPPTYAVALVTVGADSFCTGSLINNQTVLTAARCVPYISDTYAEAVLGLSNVTFANRKLHYNDPEVDIIPFNIYDVVVHPQYDNSTDANDIAIIRLRIPVKSKFKPIGTFVRKPKQLSNKNIELNNRFYGWGMKDCRETGSDSIRMAWARVVNNTKCSEVYGTPISDATYCVMLYRDEMSLAGFAPGDNGGSLVMTPWNSPILFGVASRAAAVPNQPEGSHCTDVNKPQIFTGVAKNSEFILRNAVGPLI